MIWKNYTLDDTTSKATEQIVLWQTEKGLVEINKNTLAIAIKLDDRRKGYILHGQGKFLLDTIIETEEGAIGKSVEKELDEPFLTLGDIEEIQKRLVKASDEDFTKMGYGHQPEFVTKAEDLCDQFFTKGMHSHRCFDGDYGVIFAFQNETNKLDILIVKGSKLVYKATDMAFVLNKNNVVLKSQGGVVCKIKKNQSLSRKASQS